ncbi:MAG TPA: cupredoxin domain-containing protein [Jatrophihabitans sp.]|nr:cupredoxin domain-containing protein [Jatrophihabitans sp.]
MKEKLVAPAILVLAGGLVLGGCAKGRGGTGETSGSQSAGASNYTPKTRTIDMFAAPVWIGEMSEIPQYKEFAPKDFKKGGLNDGNEVFSWQPQSIYACAGDTIKLAIGNPGPDDHTFTMPDLSINQPVPTFKVTDVTIKTTKPGLYEYYCTVAAHTRYMHGEMVVFDDSDPVCGA